MKLDSPSRQQKYFYSTSKQSLHKVFKNEKNKLRTPNSPKKLRDESLADDTANALLDSGSEEGMESQIRREPNQLNTNLTE